MNEQDFKDALHRTMTVQRVPPPMSEGRVLDAARRDRRQRRTLWAAAGSVAAVMVIAVGVVVTTPPVGGGDAAQPPPSEPVPDLTDRLLDELAAVVPAGYEAPEDVAGAGDPEQEPLRRTDVQTTVLIDGTKVWSHRSEVAVTRGDGVGRLLVQLDTPGDELGEGCELAQTVAWNIGGECTEVVVGGKRVGVITDQVGGEAGHRQFDQWAAYRYADGTMVSVAQSTVRPFADFPPLDGPIFTRDQLAALAVDPRFHLN